MVGGILALVIAIIPIQFIGDHMIPFAFLIAAIFFLISSVPSFLWVKENKQAEGIPPGRSILGLAFDKLIETFRSIKRYKEFSKYTIAFLIYNNGLMMLMGFAAIIGTTLFGLDQLELIIFVVILQITGAFGALVFGKVADRRSSKASAIMALLLLSLTLCGLFLTTSKFWFFVIGAFAGIFLSGAQTVSRSIVGQLAPPERVTEFFGFLSVAGSASTFIGPFVFGTVTFRMNNWYINNGMDSLLAEKNSLLWGIGSIIAFLAVGAVLFLLVRRIVTAHNGTA